MRAGLTARAEDWRWGSLYRRTEGTDTERQLLADSPVALGPRWIEHVNAAQSEAELESIRRGLNRTQPFGREAWTAKVTRQLKLEHPFRPRGRPRKQPED